MAVQDTGIRLSSNRCHAVWIGAPWLFAKGL